MNTQRMLRSLLPSLAAAALVTATHAAPTDIAQVPLVTSAPNAVLPNLMFILDDSGSMASDYLPDWANDSICRNSGATPANSGTFTRNCTNEPPFRSAAFNSSYYNPAITYLPPLYADGTSWPTQNSANTGGWTNVRNDAYNVQSTGNTNLITGYADVEYCTDTSYTNCLRNGNYVLPGTVNGVDYLQRRATTATGTGSIAVGAPDAATTESRTFGPHYYVINPSEFCDAPNLRNCQTTATATFKYPAPVRWCNSDANARATTPAAGSCQALATPTYSNLRIPTKYFTQGVAGVPAVAEVAASASFTVNNLNCNTSLTAVTVNGVNLLSATTTITTNRDTLGNSIRDRINAGSTGYTATTSNGGRTVRIQAPPSAGNITYTVSFARTGTCFSTNPATPSFAGYVAPVAAVPPVPGTYPGSFTRVEIIPATASYSKAVTRTDCTSSATSCSYAEEMTNFANWFTYYRTRMQSMKSSASFAFGNLSNQYRLGYMSINNATGSDFLNLGTFELTHKESWFQKLTAARPSGVTPLRGALTRVGRLYGGRLNGTSLNGSTVVDPMQYSCQQNFTLLSTDGYWNETGSPAKQLDGTTDIGNADGSLPRPLYDGTGALNTLADVAAYYYETDLRTGTAATDLCRSASGSDLCENNVPVGGVDVARHQHMTTFTLGLGVSGYMLFDQNYRTAVSGDFFDVANGTPANPANNICTWQTSGACNWPVPVNNSQPNIDDLWHAAVNGRGTYFSATDPANLYTGLASALAAIEARRGAAAAATTSNPNISAGDNSVFLSYFNAGKDAWTGELLGKTINITTGEVVDSATDWTASGQLDANTSRSILTFDATAPNKLRSFTWANLTTAERAYFETAHVTAAGRGLSQFCSFGTTCLSAANQAAAIGEPLVNYLRGDRTNEGAESDVSKFYRARQHLLGDIVNSEAVYVKKALFNYADAGYTAFKAATASRRAMVYVGANDGMLHAFDATNGSEVWAYVPTMVMPKLYALADKNYGSKHQFFVDGGPVSGDIYVGGQWRTILVGGLGAGGRGYFALDVTDPSNPQALWEFTNDNLGLTLGKVEITKLKDGTWVVIAASGYNNVSPGDGRGRLFVINAATGALIRTIDTGAGSTTTPSGMAQIRAWVDRTDVNNTTLRVYGGDNLGNVWRFDVNGDVGATGYDAQLLASLADGFGNAQPLTARPELGQVYGHAVVYVGTGRYLGVSDLTDDRQQSIYAIKDPLGATGWGNPRNQGTFVQQTFTDGVCPAGATICDAAETVRLGSSNAVDFATNGGWFIDLPQRTERADTDPQLVLGTLAFTTNILNTSACTTGGTSYLNFVDYRTGGAVSTANGVTSVFLGNSGATDVTAVGLPGGKIVGITQMRSGRPETNELPTEPPAGSTRRISWRELVN